MCDQSYWYETAFLIQTTLPASRQLIRTRVIL